MIRMLKELGKLAARLAWFGAMVAEWSWLANHELRPAVSAFWIVGGMLLVFPASEIARRVLDGGETTPARTGRVTLVLHAVLLILMGNAIAVAVSTGSHWRGWELPAPHWLSLVVLWATGIVALVSVVNLAVSGLGAPFAAALSRRLATSWLYRWTRNPMVLGTLGFLLGLGLWYRSTLFVAWVLLLATPAWLFFLLRYEERELELRFGESYREYRATTPLLFPGRRRPAPRPPAERAAPPAHAGAGRS